MNGPPPAPRRKGDLNWHRFAPKTAPCARQAAADRPPHLAQQRQSLASNSPRASACPRRARRYKPRPQPQRPAQCLQGANGFATPKNPPIPQGPTPQGPARIKTAQDKARQSLGLCAGPQAQKSPPIQNTNAPCAKAADKAQYPPLAWPI